MRTVARPPYGLPNMKKRKPKQTASEKANRAAPVGNGETANPSGGRSDAAQGAQAQGTAGDYFRKQVQAFISNLKTDCAYICDAVNESLYNDGAGLLEDESIRAPLGRIAYIDNFIRYFGVWLNVGDCAAFLSDILPDDLTMENGAYDLKVLERVPAIDKELLKDILDTGDDETSMHNFTLYIFSLWVNYHVGAVVSMFRKWLNVCANVPAVLRDVSELARCTCVYTRTADNAAGGIFYDGRWFETFALCGIKRQAANGCAQGAAADRKPDTGAADRDAARLSGAIKDLAQVIQAANLTGAPAPRTGRNVGKVSARVMAGFFGVSVSTVKNWENHPEKQRPPIVDGVKYTAAIRENGAGAFMFAQRYKDTRRGALKTVGGDKAAAVAEKQAAREWITKHAAGLRAEGANLSEWGLT